MTYESFFVDIKNRVISDLGDNFDHHLLDKLSLSLSRTKNYSASNDQYRSKAAKVPAYYNPNSHSIHLNIGVLENASEDLVENVYYHELVHAASHHARIFTTEKKVLKSGLKIQVWDENEDQHTLNRNLNEGVTQYFANTYTAGGAAYKNEVRIVGKLVARIGLNEVKSAYFGPHIDTLEEKVRVTLGEGVFQQLSTLLDEKEYEAAEALLDY